MIFGRFFFLKSGQVVDKSYTNRLLNDSALLHAKILEEAQELVDAQEPEHIAQECADVIYFALTKLIKNGGDLESVGKILDMRALKVTRRAGDAKKKFADMVKQPHAEPSPSGKKRSEDHVVIYNW